MSRVIAITFSILSLALTVGCGDDSPKKPSSNNQTVNNTVDNESYTLASCYDVAVCIGPCETADCVSECGDEGREGATQLYLDYAVCAEETCAPLYQDSCVYENCASICLSDLGNDDKTLPEYKPLDSYEGAPSGSDFTCAELAVCASECETEACAEQCASNTPQDSIDKYLTLLSCVAECQEAGGTDCPETECNTELQVCIQDV